MSIDRADQVTYDSAILAWPQRLMNAGVELLSGATTRKGLVTLESPARARLIEKVQPLFVTGDDFFISSGLDFWFTPGGAKAKVPVRWKQYLVTWSAIYPLALGVPLAIGPVLRLLGVPNNHLLTTLVVTGIVVFLMVYVVMPRYTKLIQRWLFT